MGKTSRTKGAAGERELAKLIRSHGFDCERTGRLGRTSEDVTHSIPGVHIECKRDERLSVDAMVRQAERDAANSGLLPVVAFRRNRQPWRVVVDADEYLRLLAYANPPVTSKLCGRCTVERLGGCGDGRGYPACTAPRKAA